MVLKMLNLNALTSRTFAVNFKQITMHFGSN